MNKIEFSVSVIIPVYNAINFIEKAIFSVLKLEEVDEIIVVDDGSSDGSFQIVSNLKNKHERLHLYSHMGRSNKGRSASRNLGIIKSNSPFIAFLDADDTYLENRFNKDVDMFKDMEVEGVYNCVGYEFYREAKEEEKIHFKPNTLSKPLKPTELFEGIVSSKYGFLHLNGLTVRREIFQKIGFFNENLKVTEDSDIIFKMAMKCNMLASEINQPIAKRGIHNDNIFNKNDIYIEHNPKLFESLVKWSLANKMDMDKIDTLLHWLWYHKFKQDLSILKYSFYWLNFIKDNPRLCRSSLFLKYMPLVRKRKEIFSILYR